VLVGTFLAVVLVRYNLDTLWLTPS
jgi:hypothetical protein